MKKLKILLSLFFIMGVVLIFNNTKSVAAEVQYTENVIPPMTSNTSPSGVASESSKYNGSYAAWRAFDGGTSKEAEAWVTANGTVTGWLEYDFPEAKKITKYTILPRAEYVDVNLKQVPKSWTFEAWNEQNSTWDVLDSQQNISNWESNVKKEFTFTNTNLYTKYRINISANNGYPNHTSIGELEMMEGTASNPVGDGTLKITMVTGEIKGYDATASVMGDFLTWYDKSSEGNDKVYYIFDKVSGKEYLAFDKISSFEIVE